MVSFLCDEQLCSVLCDLSFIIISTRWRILPCHRARGNAPSWQCGAVRETEVQYCMKAWKISHNLLLFLIFFFHKEKWRKTSTQSEDHLRNISLNAQYCNAHKDGMHAGKDACGLCVYLSHTLSSLLSLIQGSGVQRFIGNKIRALNVINGFDFWNGS